MDNLKEALQTLEEAIKANSTTIGIISYLLFTIGGIALFLGILAYSASCRNHFDYLGSKDKKCIYIFRNNTLKFKGDPVVTMFCTYDNKQIPVTVELNSNYLLPGTSALIRFETALTTHSMKYILEIRDSGDSSNAIRYKKTFVLL